MVGHITSERHIPAVPHAKSCLLELEAVSLPQLTPRLDTSKLGFTRATYRLEEGLRRSDASCIANVSVDVWSLVV